MPPKKQLQSMDWERVIVVPIIVFLFVVSVFALFATDNDQSSSGFVGGLHIGYRILLLLFYALVIGLFLLRTAPTAKSERLMPRVAAYVGTFLPFAIPYAGGSEVSDALAVFAEAVMAVGLAFAVYSLATLGKSFGVEPQVRTLVRHGPYRHIRHPLYVGEFVSLLGAVCFSPSYSKVAILVVAATVQVYRAVQEERLLEANIDEYADYKRHTKRFVPGLL